MCEDKENEKEKKINGLKTVPVSSPTKRKKDVERRVNFGDTLIKSLRPRDKLYSIGDSPGLYSENIVFKHLFLVE